MKSVEYPNSHKITEGMNVLSIELVDILVNGRVTIYFVQDTIAQQVSGKPKVITFSDLQA